ncbi:MAG: hypothetical protein KF861_24675 [Planctomycetaceae bacterium]|nr:hypothetical protein [Planctomycetaceae bacterium]
MVETWEERLSDASLERHKLAQRRRSEEFVFRVPVAWLAKANAVNPTAAVVGMAIWFRVGCEQSRTVAVGHAVWSRFRLSRQQAYRGLASLESIGLISIERHRGRNPVVTLHTTKARSK